VFILQRVWLMISPARSLRAQFDVAMLANPTDAADGFALRLARRRALIRGLAGQGQWAPTPDPDGHKPYRPWGGVSMCGPAAGELNTCRHGDLIGGRSYCGKTLVWVPLDGWRIGGWWHEDGTPPHRLFTHGRHPSEVCERPDSLPDPDGWLAAVVASTS
jgi:hypothetical protein